MPDHQVCSQERRGQAVKSLQDGKMGDWQSLGCAISNHRTSNDAQDSQKKEAAMQRWASKSFIFIRILRVNYFDVCEGEEPFSTMHFSFPLTIDIHPCDLHNVTNLQKRKRKKNKYSCRIQQEYRMKLEKFKLFLSTRIAFQEHSYIPSSDLHTPPQKTMHLRSGPHPVCVVISGCIWEAHHLSSLLPWGPRQPYLK